MSKPTISRRGFVGGALGLAGVAALAKSARGAATAPGMHAIRLGAPVFADAKDPEAFAQAHRELGYRAAFCPDVSLDDTDRIRAIETAFAKNDVVIAEVGRWYNMMDADEKKRAHNIETVTKGLALADAVGARCCVDIAGSMNKDVWYGPDPGNFSQEFFDAAVENARKIVDAVKPTRAKFSYEVMGWSVPDSPDTYLKLIKAVDREMFGVHLDPCNAINCPEKFYRNADLLNECFDKLGPWIVSCHAKDLKWEPEMNVHFVEVIPGTGAVDYTTWLKRLATLPNDVPLMIEHLSSEKDYDSARKFIMDTGEALRISF